MSDHAVEILITNAIHTVFIKYPEGDGGPNLDYEWIAPDQSTHIAKAILQDLAANGYQVPKALLTRDVTRPPELSPEVQRILVDVYRKNAGVAQIAERLVDLDEGFMEWRYRHVKMVQRTIGTKQGTGGSAGAEYLMTTINQPAFPDLWAIRSEL